jgi:hypothetical protein
MAISDKNTVVTQGFIDKLIDKIGKILKEQHALVERDEEQAEELELLLNKISSIENDFEELTKSLARGSYPLKLARSIKVASSSIKPHIVPVDLTKAQLIATYNELVAVLSGYIIPVTPTPDSYRGSNSDEIILETTVKGNYWAIATLENKQHQHWLVPNNNISFNIHKLKTVESLFQLKGDYDSPNSDFILEEPAVLSLLPDNKQWKLLQPGILLFSSNLKSISPQEKKSANVADDEQSKINKQLLSGLTGFQTEVDRLNSKISQLEIQSEISHQAYQREKKEWLSEKGTLNQQLGEIAELKSQLSNFKTKIVNSFDNYNQASIESDRNVNNNFNLTNESQEGSLYDETGDRQFFDKSNNQQDIKPKINLNNSYQSFYHLIKNGELEVTKVAVPQETMEKMRNDTQSEFKFLNDQKGNYWIVNWYDVYCLIPKENTNINQYQYGNFQRIFDCQNYQETYREFEVIEPAIVFNCNDETWQLERKGKIKFI